MLDLCRPLRGKRNWTHPSCFCPDRQVTFTRYRAVSPPAENGISWYYSLAEFWMKSDFLIEVRARPWKPQALESFNMISQPNTSVASLIFCVGCSPIFSSLFVKIGEKKSFQLQRLEMSGCDISIAISCRSDSEVLISKQLRRTRLLWLHFSPVSLMDTEPDFSPSLRVRPTFII